MNLITKKILYVCLSYNILYGTANSAVLSLDGFIQKVIKNNPGVQKILADEAIANAKLKASYGVEDSILSSSLSLGHAEPDQVTGREATRIDNQKFNLSLEKKFINSGTQLLFAYQNSGTEQLPAAQIAGTTYNQPSLTLQLILPLMKNSGGIQDRLNINIDKLGLELTRYSVREELESYITQLASLFIDWELSYREMKILHEVFQQVLEQEKVVKLKVNRQVAEKYELLRIQETVQDYYSRWQQSVGKYNGLTHQLINQLNDITINKQNIKPQEPENSRIMSAEEQIRRGENYLQNASRLKKILDLTKAQQLELFKARKNEQDPELNLSLNYTAHGIDNNFSNSYNSFDNDYSVMLKYKQPIGNSSAIGKYQEQVAVSRKIEDDTKQKMINAVSSLESLTSQSEKLIIAVDSSNKKIELAKLKLRQEYQLYKIGRLDLFQLLQDQKSQLESRLGQVQIKSQLLKFKLSIGELLDRNLDVYTSENI